MLNVHNLINESVRRHYADIEAYVRSYIREHRTTRLDIEVSISHPRVMSDGDNAFMLRTNSDEYEVRYSCDIQIRQKLPQRWRPALPD